MHDAIKEKRGLGHENTMSGESEVPVTSRAKRHSRTRNGCERCRAQHRKCENSDVNTQILSSQSSLTT